MAISNCKVDWNCSLAHCPDKNTKGFGVGSWQSVTVSYLRAQTAFHPSNLQSLVQTLVLSLVPSKYMNKEVGEH